MFVTTLEKIRSHGPCQDGWEQLLKHLGKTKADDEPLSLLSILDSNGLDDALWCCRAVEGHDRDFRLFAVWCARPIQHPLTDERSLLTLDVAERHANGLASDEELSAARAAWDAACFVAEDVAEDAARRVAAEAIGDAAGDAAGAAARAAGDTAWFAAGAAAGAAGDTAWNAAAGAAARAKQEARFRQMLIDGAFIGSTQPEETCAA